MLLILFGLPGSGKSYIGNILKEEFGFYHYEADEDLTSEIKEAIHKEKKISDIVRDDFINRVCQRISELLPLYQNIVVTQTFTKEKDRQKIRSQFREATFIRVEAKWSLIESRLKNRNGHIVKKSYAELSREIFEPYGVSHFVLKNNEGEEAIRAQLWSILADALRCKRIPPARPNLQVWYSDSSLALS
jgi:gluconate kinase